MANKQDAILEYIESLKTGERISVRQLARVMSVSEGTAYKAIKKAKAKGLIITRPRGSVRISAGGTPAPGDFTLTALIRQLGLTVLAGEPFTGEPVGPVVLGDGDVDQLRRSIKGAGKKPLCIVGGRPEIIQAAVSLGANVIVTGGAAVDNFQLTMAAGRQSCILSSAQDSYTLLNRLSVGRPPGGREGVCDTAGNWMRTPMYLYYNDIAADLHNLYRPMLSQFSKCAVVDDDLKICGTVDAIRVLAEAPSQKISKLYLSEGECYAADIDVSMESLADRMISEGTATAYITKDGKLCGVITANDVLRYYRAGSAGAGAAGRYAREMESVGCGKEPGTHVYMIKLPERAELIAESFPDYIFSLLQSAARRQCEALLGGKCDFESGTFYSLNKGYASDELMISCETVKKAPFGCTVEAEICDATSCYARCILVASVPGAPGLEKGV